MAKSNNVFEEIIKTQKLTKRFSVIVVIIAPFLIMLFKGFAIIIGILVLFFMSISSYVLQFSLQSYVMKFHSEEFRQFQKENYFLSISSKGFYRFLDSKYFKVKTT